jgi:hypothetical protein
VVPECRKGSFSDFLVRRAGSLVPSSRKGRLNGSLKQEGQVQWFLITKGRFADSLNSRAGSVVPSSTKSSVVKEQVQWLLNTGRERSGSLIQEGQVQ